MSLKSLDYLTTREGGAALAICLTEYINQLDKHPPQTMEDYDISIEETLKNLESLVGDNKKLIQKALKELSLAQTYASVALQSIGHFSGGEMNSVALISGLLYAGANMSTVKDMDTHEEQLSKRNFIRTAVLMYDLYQIVYRNRTMLDTDTRIN